jgi:hypothetical protein
MAEPAPKKLLNRYGGIDFSDLNSHPSMKVTDVELICKDGKKLYAHRLELIFLPYFSDILKDLLCVKEVDKKLTLEFKEFDSKILEIVLYYAYGLLSKAIALIHNSLQDISLFDQLLLFIDGRGMLFLLHHIIDALKARKFWSSEIYPIIVKHSKYGKNKTFLFKLDQDYPLEYFFFQATCSVYRMDNCTTEEDLKFFISHYPPINERTIGMFLSFDINVVIENFNLLDSKTIEVYQLVTIMKQINVWKNPKLAELCINLGANIIEEKKKFNPKPPKSNRK